jgi:spore coat polysaccharide biosynthesis protein SpsF
MLQHVIDRCKRSRADNVVLALPDTPENDVLAGIGGVEYYRGSEHDVLRRYYEAALTFKAQIVVRVTADCPLIDPHIIDEVLEFARSTEYVSCVGYPRGVWCEAFPFEMLSSANTCATKPYHREHVTPYMIENAWMKGSLKNSQPSDYRLCVDEPDDMRMVRLIVDRLGEECTTNEIVRFLDGNPDLICNSHVRQQGAPCS